MKIQDCDECDWSKFHELKQELHRLTAENERLKEEMGYDQRNAAKSQQEAVELLDRIEHIQQQTAARCAEIVMQYENGGYIANASAKEITPIIAQAIRKEFGLDA